MNEEKKLKVIQHFKTHWVAYLFGAALILMLYLLLSGNKPVESHRVEYDERDKVWRLTQDSLNEYKMRDALQARVIIQTDSAKRQTIAALEVTRRELGKSRSLANRLAAEVQAMQPEDTSVFAHKVDSLTNEVSNLSFLLDDASKQYDSLSKINATQQATYDQMLADRAKVINEINTAYTKEHSSYEGLYKDYKSLSKKLAREKFKTKSAAVIAAAAIVYGFIK